MKFHNYISLSGLLIVIIFLNGCFMPAATHCKGTVSISANQDEAESADQEISNRFILISLWDYPTVNNTPGKIIINEAIAVETKEITVDFPHKVYWTVWTPALGTQHLSPVPVIILFHEKYPLRFGYGSSDAKFELCCEKPKTKRHYSFELGNPEEILSAADKKSYRTKLLLKKFIQEKETLIKKIEQCKSITHEEKNMILIKIKQIETELDIQKNSIAK